MNAVWLGLCGAGFLVVWLLRDALTDMCKEEIRTRLVRLPHAVLRVVAIRIPRGERQEVLAEWSAELDFILSETDGLPVTRLLRGVWYSVSLLGLLLPFTVARDRIAAYWWEVTRRLHSASWVRVYVWTAVTVDGFSALAAGLLAFHASVEGHGHAVPYLRATLILPVLWVLSIKLADGYSGRFIGTGSDEFRKVLNASVSLTATVASFSYLFNTELARAYLLIALPGMTVLGLLARFAMRKQLHQQRKAGHWMMKVVAVGHEPAVARLISELSGDQSHGYSVVASCLAVPSGRDDVAGVPVYGGLDDITAAVRAFAADTVAVLPCPEMDGIRIRSLAWDLEKTGTGLCVSPALLDVAGPRTTIRPRAGLTLLHVDHPQLGGIRLAFKDLFDRAVAAAALVLLLPLMIVLAAVIWLHDRGPVLFTQVRVGKDGRAFRIYKFRTMVVDAEERRPQRLTRSDTDGILFKLRKDPRVTAVGFYLRRWSVDELPQLINVFLGDMSLVGPRPALPDEAAKYADHVRRRLVVRPGLTGLWQVNGRSDLSWEESVRLDLRYVENWSFVLDVQILWKTISVLLRGSGAY
jgi:exopolysaccharide biosynthesis polyprenyl glycosylphosphotransferase